MDEGRVFSKDTPSSSNVHGESEKQSSEAGTTAGRRLSSGSAGTASRRGSSSGAPGGAPGGAGPSAPASKVTTPQTIELDPGLLAFVTDIRSLVDRGHVQQMSELQRNILMHAESSGDMLREFNDYSQQTYTHVMQDFTKNTRLLKDMKKDLDYIFKHTRTLREKIRSKYPESFEGLHLKRPDAPEDE